MIRTFDQEYKCTHFILIEQTVFNAEYPSLDKRVRWCYENIPVERLWCYNYEPYIWRYDYEPYNKNFAKGLKVKDIRHWTLRFFFEIQEDAMAFKLVWL